MRADQKPRIAYSARDLDTLHSTAGKASYRNSLKELLPTDASGGPEKVVACMPLVISLNC